MSALREYAKSISGERLAALSCRPSRFTGLKVDAQPAKKRPSATGKRIFMNGFLWVKGASAPRRAGDRFDSRRGPDRKETGKRSKSAVRKI
jgi:hypothetical protein